MASTTITLRETSLKQKLIFIRGKLGRFYHGHFQKAYVTRQLAIRKGACARCGTCCKLLFKCAMADQCEGGTKCRIYRHRPVNCRIFPLNERDLAERDLLMPDRPCGYYFEK